MHGLLFSKILKIQLEVLYSDAENFSRRFYESYTPVITYFRVSHIPVFVDGNINRSSPHFTSITKGI